MDRNSSASSSIRKTEANSVRTIDMLWFVNISSDEWAWYFMCHFAEYQIMVTVQLDGFLWYEAVDDPAHVSSRTTIWRPKRLNIVHFDLWFNTWSEKPHNWESYWVILRSSLYVCT